MLTLGYITKLNSSDSNLFEVRLPIFEKAGTNSSSPELSGSYFEANLGYNPGNLNAYKVGDCVVVGFLDSKFAKPIILGKLYTGDETSASNYSFDNSLVVTNYAKLPTHTIIGDLKYSDLQRVSRQADYLETLIKEEDASGPLDGNAKEITMSLAENGYKIIVNLHNFNSSDVGNKIYLYRTCRRKKKGYKHPSDYTSFDIDTEIGDGSITGYGYGTVAGNPRNSSHSIFYPGVPSWMVHKGFIQTEWIITQEMVDAGYFEIDWRYEWTPLALYNQDSGKWSEVYGTGRTISKLHGAIKFKFGYVINDVLVSLSSDSVVFGKRAKYNNTTEIVSVVNQRLKEEYIYLTIR